MSFPGKSVFLHKSFRVELGYLQCEVDIPLGKWLDVDASIQTFTKADAPSFDVKNLLRSLSLTDQNNLLSSRVVTCFG